MLIVRMVRIVKFKKTGRRCEWNLLHRQGKTFPLEDDRGHTVLCLPPSYT